MYNVQCTMYIPYVGIPISGLYGFILRIMIHRMRVIFFKDFESSNGHLITTADW